MSAYEGSTRADYAPVAAPGGAGAVIASVAEGSPAWEAGLESGMIICTVNGAPLTDIIAWRWEADGQSVELSVAVPCEEGLFSCILERDLGVDWGIEFTDVIFDELKTCVNACEFCFLRMLPKGERESLYVRDDDYRLSFLQGNFVTLTNVSDSDVKRICNCKLSPMNVSLHAISPEVRRRLIGPHAGRGIEVLQQLLEAKIEVHGQIVVCPGINDGDELRATLDWIEPWESFTSLALVPKGYTRFAPGEHRSFSDDVDAARAVVRLLEPYQRRARSQRGITRFQLSDEFYLAAQLELPDAESYDGYPQFYDGIGMLRSFIDEADELCCTHRAKLDDTLDKLKEQGLRVRIVCGEAAVAVVSNFARAWASDERIFSQAIRNDYYGGNVNVTGLIVAKDLLSQLPKTLAHELIVLPESMFNAHGDTLDASDQAQIAAAVSARGGLAVVSCTSPSSIVEAVAAALEG